MYNLGIYIGYMGAFLAGQISAVIIMLFFMGADPHEEERGDSMD